MLATDGEPSGCDGDADRGRARSKSAVADAYAAGVRTFVVGVGPEASDQHLPELANLGQGHEVDDPMNRFYRVLDTQALASALAVITGDVQACVFGLNGWHLEGPSRLSIDGAACESIQSSAASMLDISFPCGVFAPS